MIWKRQKDWFVETIYGYWRAAGVVTIDSEVGMKSLFIFAMMLTTGIGTAKSQGRGTKAALDARAEQAVRRLEREWLDAGHNKDLAAIYRILADDFIITFGDGSVRDKAEVMRRLRVGTRNPNEYDWTEDSKVRVHGNKAIIVGRYRYRLRENNKETISESRYTDTYIKRKGHWQVVASHLSDIVKK